jgi:hypothetical protein
MVVLAAVHQVGIPAPVKLLALAFLVLEIMAVPVMDLVAAAAVQARSGVMPQGLRLARVAQAPPIRLRGPASHAQVAAAVKARRVALAAQVAVVLALVDSGREPLVPRTQAGAVAVALAVLMQAATVAAVS